MGQKLYLKKLIKMKLILVVATVFFLIAVNAQDLAQMGEVINSLTTAVPDIITAVQSLIRALGPLFELFGRKRRATGELTKEAKDLIKSLETQIGNLEKTKGLEKVKTVTEFKDLSDDQIKGKLMSGVMSKIAEMPDLSDSINGLDLSALKLEAIKKPSAEQCKALYTGAFLKKISSVEDTETNNKIVAILNQCKDKNDPTAISEDKGCWQMSVFADAKSKDKATESSSSSSGNNHQLNMSIIIASIAYYMMG